MSVCIGCGCDEQHACLDPTTGQGCSWLRADPSDDLGVCSSCPEHVARFDAGDHEPTEEAMEAFADRISAEPPEAAPALILPGDPEFDARFGAYRRR